MKFGNPVYSYDTGDANYASTGTKVFGYDAGLGFGVEPYWDNQNIFRAFFSSSAKYVAIDVIKQWRGARHRHRLYGGLVN